MSKFTCAFGLVLVVFASACGPGGGGGTSVGHQLSPLTADQKATVIETVTSLGRIEKAASYAASLQADSKDKSKAKSAAATAEPDASASPSPEPSPSPIYDETPWKMSSQLTDGCKLEQAIKSSPVQDESDTNSPIDFSIGLKATGAGCPIALDQFFAVTGTESKSTIENRMSYQVQNEAYRALNDIDRVTYRATGDLTVALVTKSSGTASMKVEGAGALHSQKQGELQIHTHSAMSFEGEEKKDRAEMSESSFRIDFATFSAELRSIRKYQKLGGKKINDERKYYFNNQEITAEEFDDIRSKGGSIFETLLDSSR